PWNRTDGPGVSLAVSIDGTTVSRQVGMADLEQGRPIDDGTVFHAASLSKQFTAFAILLLERDGRLSIEDPLARHLPEAAHLGPITLRQLLNHTSGLREQGSLLAAAGWRREDLVTDQQVLQMLLAQRRGNFPPGTAYQYSNSGYSLLAEVVRRVSGQSLQAFCQQRIFDPLGMRRTRFQDSLAALLPGRAQSYGPTASGHVRMPLNYAVAGPTGLKTTAEDLLRWAHNFTQPVVGDAALMARMREQGQVAGLAPGFYALGQERHPYRGLDTWSHGGRDAGFRSFLLRIPAADFAVAVLSNAAEVDAAALAYGVADRVLADHPQWQPATRAKSRPSRRQLRAYAGDYELFPALIFSITTDGRQLYFHTGQGSEPTALPAPSATEFELDPSSNLALVFEADDSKPASALGYRIGLNGTLTAPRIQLQPFQPDPQRWPELTGRYDSAELQTSYWLQIDAGQLVARHPRRPPIRLRPYQADTFAGSDGALQKVVFQRDAAGEVTGLRLDCPLAEGIEFVRNEP
ncbi:MAG: serine hydrolase, partial [Xanthomonadales bacterium]|nr:serine hydrolase [Xanthomonadales bacterium]